MLGVLNKMVFKHSSCEIEKALISIAGHRNVIRAKKHCASNDLLIEAVAKVAGISAEKLLAEVSREIDLPPQFTYKTPSFQTLTSSGFTEEELRKFKAIIQTSSNANRSFELVVADPSLIAIEAFRKANIPVKLGLGSAIQNTWEGVEAEHQVEEKEVLKCLLSVIENARAHGASEIQINNASPILYTFSHNNSSYVGDIPVTVRRRLLQTLQDKNSVTLRIDKNDISSIVIKRRVAKNVEELTISWQTTEGNVIEHTLDSSKGEYEIEGQTIALVEDDSRFAALLVKVLESKGHQVIYFTNGLQALAWLKKPQTSATLIISDVHMPEMDGFSLIKELRSSGDLTPVLFLTSDDDPMTEANLALLGAASFVKKQSDPRVLLAWVQNLYIRQTSASLESPKRAVG